jgi:hypothetical protein
LIEKLGSPAHAGMLDLLEPLFSKSMTRNSAGVPEMIQSKT